MTTRTLATISLLLGLVACGGSSSGSSSLPPNAGTTRARFVEGAPELEALINGVPQSIEPAYLQVDGQTVSSSFTYATFTQFVNLSPGVHQLQALDVLGYKVGPFKSASLTAGKSYTLVLVGSYPKYEILTFAEPADSKTAQLSLYEASPSVPSADFGSFTTSGHSNFKQLGSASLGNVSTVTVGKSVSSFGGYAGRGTKAFKKGKVTPANVNPFDHKDVLPFNNASRLSLFLFDGQGNFAEQVFGSLDR